MFYVSSMRSRNVFGITDTLDGVEEFYNKDDISCFLARGMMILGASFKNMNGNLNINVIGRESAKFLRLQSGMPVRVKLSGNLPFKQFILIRIETDGVMLFDGTLSKLSFSFMDVNNVVVDTENNDAIRVTELLTQIRNAS